MIDGVDQGQKHYSVYAGESVTLVCGTGLIDNPEPIVTWTNPPGASIQDGDEGRYAITEGPNATVTINNVTKSDEGIWKCTVEVNSDIPMACPDSNTSSRIRHVEMEVVVIGKLVMISWLNNSIY